jgi:hypothetical protein
LRPYSRSKISKPWTTKFGTLVFIELSTLKHLDISIITDGIKLIINTGKYLPIYTESRLKMFNPLNAELNPICHLLALLGGATIVVVSRLGVKVKFNRAVCLVSALCFIHTYYH